MVLHDHSNHFRKVYSVTQGQNTIAVMKPFTQLRGWWMLEMRGGCWINPLARDIAKVRQQANSGEWPTDAIAGSMYNNTPRFMLVKSKHAALIEMHALNKQCGEPN